MSFIPELIRKKNVEDTASAKTIKFLIKIAIMVTMVAMATAKEVKDTLFRSILRNLNK